MAGSGMKTHKSRSKRSGASTTASSTAGAFGARFRRVFLSITQWERSESPKRPGFWELLARPALRLLTTSAEL